MLRTAVITSALVLAMVGCSDDDKPPTPEPGELIEIDGPAQVENDTGGAEIPG